MIYTCIFVIIIIAFSVLTLVHLCTGPAIVHFQQTKQGFWEPLVLVIGICEAYRVSVGWANPVDKGTFTLRDEYAPGDLGCGS